MSAFGGKTDMTFALHMSAFDPKRTWLAALPVVQTSQQVAFQTRQKVGTKAARQSPRRLPATALLLYQRAAPAWNGRIVLRVKLAATVSAAAG
jgi:hypothetical protein